MKKLIIITLLLVTPLCFADNTDRIKELTTEAQELQKNLTQYNQVINNIQVRLIQIQAVITELTEQDKKDDKE